jgi:PAS domain S-box-containing protein
VNPRIIFIIKIVGIATLYFISGGYGLQLGAVSKFATYVWPPTGIALAAAITFGINIWPGIFLGAFLLNYFLGVPFLTAFGIGFGNTLEAVVAISLLRQIPQFQKKIENLKGAFAFILIGAVLSPLVAATIGTLSLFLSHNLSTIELPQAWFAWWFGDAIGALVVAPFLLALIYEVKYFRLSISGFAHATAIILITVFFGSTIYWGLLPTVGVLHWPYFLFPILFWSGIRFHLTGTTTLSLLVATIAIWGTVQGTGFFAGSPLTTSLFHVQTFIGVFSISGLVFGSSIAEWARAEKELRENNNILSAVIEGTREAIFVKDLKGKYLLLNSATARAMGRSHEEIVGKTDAELLPTRNAQKIMSDDQKVITSKASLHLESELPDKKGQPHIFSSAKSPYYNSKGDVIGVIGISRDVTDEKEAEKKLKQAVTIRDEFLSIASHELKTPLTSLKMQIQMTQRRINIIENSAPTPQKLSQALEISSKQIDRLSNLVDQLLDVSRIEAGRLEYFFQPTNLLEVIEEIVEQFEVQLNSSKCTLKISVDGQITGIWDRSRIEQILVNLISNAIKYAPAKEIVIGAEIVNNGTERVVLRVEDQGPGIPEAEQPFLFERFTRATNLKHLPGLGLGLFIVKKIIEAHKGYINVESIPREGTKFVVNLPMNSSY